MTGSGGKGKQAPEKQQAGFAIRVGEIPSHGVHRTFALDDVSAIVAEAVDAQVSGFEARVDVGVPDGSKSVDVQVTLDLQYATPCDRCGEAVEVRLESTETLRYQPEEPPRTSPSDPEEVELGEDELDVGWYRDGTLSLADVVSEAIALALPMRNACEDTAGCDARTAKLLEGAAEQPSGHPGFAALKNWT